MISSTRADLYQYREEARKIIRKVASKKEQQVQLIEVSMEKETQSGDREFAVAVSKRWVEKADWVVVIVGWNYGTISDEAGAEGLSVTEWEYRHALSLSQSPGAGRKLFVFIAGEPGTPNRYRALAEEQESVDLKDWIPRQTREQKEKLDRFRQELAKAHADMFADLNMFRDRLETTLEEAADGLLSDIQPGTPLADVIAQVTPHIRDCIRRVTVVVNCKLIHDRLHEMLQHVIRPLREEVVSKWVQEGTLSDARERAIWGRVTTAAGELGAIRELSRAFGADHRHLRTSVDKVLQQPPLWSVEEWASPDRRPSLEDFVELVDKLAGAVQDAFSEADRSMTEEESDLRVRYSALCEGLKQARQQRRLSSGDQERLDDELQKVDANRSRMKGSLTTHHRWQETHDKLHELDSLRETTLFRKKLNQFRETGLPRLLDLVDRELAQPECNPANGAEPEQEVVTAVDGQVPPASSPEPSQPGGTPVDDWLRLKDLLAAVRQDDGVFAFDNMLRPFDDAFYRVDKRTKEEVESASKRVHTLDEWLDVLASKARLG